MNFPEAIPGALSLLSLALLLWQWLAARRFPLHRRVTDSSFAPAITLLKPLKGGDATAAESFQSWFRQDYAGPLQILFGVTDANDSAGPIVRELIKKIPAAMCNWSSAPNRWAPAARSPPSSYWNGWRSTK